MNIDLSKTVSGLKKKVSSYVKTEHKTKFISDDENFNYMFDTYSTLGTFANQLNNLARESVTNLQKSCGSNKEVASCIQQYLEGQLRENFDIQSVTEKFLTLQTMIGSTHMNDMVAGMQSEFLRPLVKDRELDTQTQAMLDGKIIDERLVDHLTSRTQERTLLVAESILAIMEVQYRFFKSVADSYADFHELLAPAVNTIKARKNGKPQSKPSHPQSSSNHPQPPHRPQANTAPQQMRQSPQTSPQYQQHNPQPPKPSNPNLHSSTDLDPEHNNGNFGTPNQTSSPPQPQQSNSNNTYPASVPTQNLLGEDFLSGSQKEPNQNSSTPLFSFDDSPSPASPPLRPATTHNSNDIFAQFNSTPKNTNSNMFDEFASFDVGSSKPAPASTQSSSYQNSQNFQPSDNLDPFAFNSRPTTQSQGFGSFDDILKPNPPPPQSTPQQNKPSPTPTPTPTPKMDAVMEKQIRDQEKEKEATDRLAIDAQVTLKVETWAGSRKSNLRALISTLHQILWEGSGWKETGLGELLQPGSLRSHFKRALLVVHPDKTSNKPLETRLLAERVFDILQEAAKTATW